MYSPFVYSFCHLRSYMHTYCTHTYTFYTCIVIYDISCLWTVWSSSLTYLWNNLIFLSFSVEGVQKAEQWKIEKSPWISISQLLYPSSGSLTASFLKSFFQGCMDFTWALVSTKFNLHISVPLLTRKHFAKLLNFCLPIDWNS